MLAGAGDGREALVAEAGHLAAECQQLVGRRHLRLVLCRFQPAEEAAHRHAVSPVRRACAGLLDRVFARLRQQARVGPVDHDRTGIPQNLADRRRGARRVHPHRAPGQPGHRRHESGRRLARHLVAKPLPRLAIDLGGVDEQVSPAVRMQDRECQCDRSERHIPAAQVQQPVDAWRVGQHAGILPGAPQRRGDGFPLGRRRLAGKRQPMRHRRGGRGGRAPNPDRVDWVRRQRHHHDACLRVALHAVTAQQPRVVAQPFDAARRPILGRRLRQMEALEHAAIRLRAELEHVAPIREHRRLRQRHDRQSGASGEPGQPGEALCTRGNHTRPDAHRPGER